MNEQIRSILAQETTKTSTFKQRRKESYRRAHSVILQKIAAPRDHAGDIVVPQAGFNGFQLAARAAQHCNF